MNYCGHGEKFKETKELKKCELLYSDDKRCINYWYCDVCDTITFTSINVWAPEMLEFAERIKQKLRLQIDNRKLVD